MRGSGDAKPVSFKFSERFQAAAKRIAHASRAPTRKGAVMIFRAIFWIGLVSLLTPHEPDLGLGHPGAGISPPAVIKSWSVTGLSHPDCNGGACVGGLGGLDQWRASTGQGLADIRAEIDASIKARKAAERGA
jgi:hypothetical protein